ncbi:MAG: molybdate ABC transporter substrate-binding protein [Campylobacterota bacterium]|nr:molybdate ABC transporter substrate-binding protein [Campylobacterota bacterium]
MLFIVSTSNASTIRIAVAANVSYAITPLIEAFNVVYPKTKVQVILGSSGKLTAQITHGAPYDLFMSADMKYPNALYASKKSITVPVIYAQGALALFSRTQRDYCAEIFVLKDKDIGKIAIANPKTAPYGLAAKEALTKVKLYEVLKPKFVHGESISQTVSYAMTATDIGIIAKSSLFSPQMQHFKEAIHWAEVDDSLYTPIDQGMIILQRAKENVEVQAFYDFMLGTRAQEILKTFGYKTR